MDLCSESDDSDAAQEANAGRETSGQRARRKREVTTEEGELWAKEEGLLFVEASAKSGVNVEFAFEEATRDILRKIHTGVFDDERVRPGSFHCMHAVTLTNLPAPLSTVSWRETLATENRRIVPGYSGAETIVLLINASGRTPQRAPSAAKELCMTAPSMFHVYLTIHHCKTPMSSLVRPCPWKSVAVT